jgi:hypothetical protein
MNKLNLNRLAVNIRKANENKEKIHSKYKS